MKLSLYKPIHLQKILSFKLHHHIIFHKPLFSIMLDKLRIFECCGQKWFKCPRSLAVRLSFD